MALSTQDGLDWFRQAGIKLTPEQEAQAIEFREEQRRERLAILGAMQAPSDVPMGA